jgi:hypothetical protein
MKPRLDHLRNPDTNSIIALQHNKLPYIIYIYTLLHGYAIFINAAIGKLAQISQQFLHGGLAD